MRFVSTQLLTSDIADLHRELDIALARHALAHFHSATLVHAACGVLHANVSHANRRCRECSLFYHNRHCYC
jgi:hypothetical protein